MNNNVDSTLMMVPDSQLMGKGSSAVLRHARPASTIVIVQSIPESEEFMTEEPQVARGAELSSIKPEKDKKEKKLKEKSQKAPPKPTVPELPFYKVLGQKLYDESIKETVSAAAIENGDSATTALFTSPVSRDTGPSADFLMPPKPLSHTRSSSRSSQEGHSDISVSTGSLSDLEAQNPARTAKLKGNLYSLDDFKRLETINRLIAQYSTVSHMSVRDPSYFFWVNSTRTAVVHFKLVNKVAVLAGDPLCPPPAMPSTLEEFERYCRKNGWKTSIIGASEGTLEIAKLKKWPALRFGIEKVLNPVHNEVLLGKSGKRTAAQCKQLLDPAKGGLSLSIYLPGKGRDNTLETELTRVYDDWRRERNTNRDCQAFITVFEMFSLPDLMTFIYTMNNEGKINGFAALRRMGVCAAGGYHIDPFIQLGSAPRGTSDLLIFASLAYLNVLGVSYLGLGHEPINDPDAMYNMNSFTISATRRVYRHIFGRLPVGGKETFNSRWKPDAEQEAGLYLIFVGRKTPSLKHLLAMTHFANIRLRSVLKADWKDFKQELGNHSHLPLADINMMLYSGAAVPEDASRNRPALTKSVSAPAATI